MGGREGLVDTAVCINSFFFHPGPLENMKKLVIMKETAMRRSLKGDSVLPSALKMEIHLVKTIFLSIAGENCQYGLHVS